MRARWVQHRMGGLAILLNVVHDAALVRWAGHDGGYAWLPVTDLRRRPELDANPEPAWLQQARLSRRPNSALWWLLDRIPAPPDDLAGVTDPSTGLPVPMFDTDADGRPLT